MKIVTLIFIVSILNSQIPYFESYLPIVIIDTNGQTIIDEPKIHASMGIIYHSNGSINKSTDSFNHYSGKISIEIRGSTSQEYFPKKSYAFETKNSNFEDKDESLLGLPEEEDWILYGPYGDKTLMRNVVIYELSRQMGNYASRTKFCELVLNEEYIGVYVLMEKLKQDLNRINISKLKSSDISGDDLTGGYVIKIDKDTGKYTESWMSTFPPFEDAWQRICYQYHSPKPDKLVSQQKQYIQDWLYDFENIMYSERNSTISAGYDWIDINSAVDYFLISELVKNKDAYYASIFMYKDKDSNAPKLHMGPVWDMNLSTGNNYGDALRSPQGWRFEIPLIQWELDNSQINGPFWFNMLWRDIKFKQKFATRWNSKRNNVLSNQNISTLIDSCFSEFNAPANHNFYRWNILGVAVWPITYYNNNNYVLDTYEEEVMYLKEWFNERLEWIDSELANGSDTTVPTTPTNFTGISNNGF
ncbi:MAG: CotH kinase family protein, partial [Candidatus Marinimicrobia bacterium]|nr:CotH kinase family protein [Candidatus Neomarinimicrobiota bacterium]